MAVPRQKRTDPSTAEVNRLSDELRDLRARLQECEDTIAAIRGGGVDAIVVSGTGQEQVFTLAGTENAYRVFVEAMDEGAITVNSAGTILFANKAAANLLARPLGMVIGGSIFGFVPESERSQFDAIFRRTLRAHPHPQQWRAGPGFCFCAQLRRVRRQSDLYGADRSLRAEAQRADRR